MSRDTVIILVSLDANYYSQSADTRIEDLKMSQDIHLCLSCTQSISKTDYDTHHGHHQSCFIKLFSLTKFEDFSKIVQRESTTGGLTTGPRTVDPAGPFGGTFFHGKYKKFSGHLGGSDYILKIREDTAPELPDVEFLCNQIGKSLGINVPWHGLIDFYGIRTFVTRNFVSEQKDTSTLNHIYHYLTPSTFSCEHLIEVIYKETTSFQDVETFIYTCLFDSLIGNHDRHGRNLGLLVSPKRSRLSQIYDNTSMLGLHSGTILKAQFEPTGRISTQAAKEPRIADYVVEFERLGQFDVVQRFVKAVDLKAMVALIRLSKCTSLMQDAMHRLVEQRVIELTNAIQAR